MEHCDIGVTIALKEEFDTFIQLVPIKSKLHPIDAEYYYLHNVNDSNFKIISTLLGEPGLIPSASKTMKFIYNVNPKLIIHIGIGGALSDDHLLGDVILAGDVNDYMYNSKVTDDSKKGFKFQYSGRPWVLNYKLQSFFKNYSYISINSYSLWQNSVYVYKKTLELNSEQKTLIRVKPDFFVANIMSGNTVVASDNYKKELKEIDRKSSLVEMEAGGITNSAFSLADPIDVLILRGVSDLSDINKNKIETINKGAYRKYAMYSATTFFINLLLSREFQDIFKTIKSDRQINDSNMESKQTKIINGSYIKSYNQTGGQIAHNITNVNISSSKEKTDDSYE